MPAKQQTRSLSARFQDFSYSFKKSFAYLATGGEWAVSQPREARRSLIWFWLDGLFASASDNIVVTYLTVFLLAIGASQSQIGLMSSLSSLSAALCLLPGAMLVERIGRRRGIVLASGAWTRSALLLLALLPFFFSGPTLIIVAIALSISRDAMGNLSYPAWISLTGDVVPMIGRGRYFASRNFIMAITGMCMTFLIGLLISNTQGIGGFQIALGLAFLFGVVGVYSFGHITDRPAAPPAPAAEDGEQARAQRVPLREQVREIFSHRDFTQFAVVTALWNIGLNFAGPFFNVYLVQNLHADAAMVGLTSIASSLANMMIQMKLGEIHDRWGARKLTMVAGLLIPIVPVAWAFIDSAWWVIPINLVSGVFWAAYNMGSFNYLLMITPSERRARYSAIFQVIVTASLAAGAALGSLAIDAWGFGGVFIGSSAGRMLAALLFALIIFRAGKKRTAAVTPAAPEIS